MVDRDQCSSWNVVHQNGRTVVLKDPRPGSTRRYVVIDDSEDREHLYEHFTAYRFDQLPHAVEQAACCALNGLDGQVDDALADFDHAAPDAAERLKAVLEILKAAARKHDDEENDADG